MDFNNDFPWTGDRDRNIRESDLPATDHSDCLHQKQLEHKDVADVSFIYEEEQKLGSPSVTAGKNFSPSISFVMPISYNLREGDELN